MGKFKQKAPAQFVRMPDGTVKVVSATETKSSVQVSQTEPKKRSYKKFATLNIHFSNLKKIKIADFRQKKYYLSASMVVALVMLMSFAALVTNKQVVKTTKVLGTTNNNSSKKTLPRENPKFKILLPSGDQKNIISDIVRSTPNNVAPGYRYFDDINGSTISVTQQQLPESFKADVASKVAAMAKDFQANNVIKINDNIVYHGINEKTKQQSLIFTKNNLLVFIISEKKLSDDDWAGYITSLM